MISLKLEHVLVEIELEYRGNRIKTSALVDTGAARSVISKELAMKLGAFIPLDKPYKLKTANEEGYLIITGYARLGVRFQGVEIPGGCTFEVAENLRKGIHVIIGRPEIDSWGIILTKEGARLRKIPVEFEII